MATYHNITRGQVVIPVMPPIIVQPNGDIETDDALTIAACERLVPLRQLAAGPRPA